MLKAESIREYAAVHAAGHVTAWVKFGSVPAFVTIDPASPHDDQVEPPPDWMEEHTLDPFGYSFGDRLIIDLLVRSAGPVAQAVFSQSPLDWKAAKEDQASINRTLRLLFPLLSAKERQKFAHYYEERAHVLVQEHTATIERVATMLLGYGSLTGPQITAHCADLLKTAWEDVASAFPPKVIANVV